MASVGDHRSSRRAHTWCSRSSSSTSRCREAAAPPSSHDGRDGEEAVQPFVSLAIGLISGSFGGLLGIGGGAVMVPLLTGWARVDQHAAHGTSLVGVVFTGIVGALVYGKGAAVDWQAALLIAAGAVPATVFAARSTPRIPADTLRRFFGVFLIANGILLQFKGAVPVTGVLDGAAATVSLVLLGVFAGGLSGLLGVGGGAVMVPALALGPGFIQQLAQGTSLAAMVPSGAVGATVHARLGHVRRDVVFPLMAGIATGSWIGGSGALALPDRTLRVIFSVVLVWLGARYLFRRTAPAAASS